MGKRERDDGKQLVKAKTKKGMRALEKRAPKLEEGAKKILVLQGNKVSQLVKDVLLDINKLKHGDAVKYTRKNEVRPFEAGHEATLQFFCERSDCALFCLGQHSKKRPDNIVLGRMFNFQLLDMLELGIKRHTPITSFMGATKVQSGSKPCFLFLGERFEQDTKFKLAKSLLLDTFRGQATDEMNLMGFSHVIACYATGDKTLLLRHYAILLKKSGTRVPRVVLEEAGPVLDFEIRRVHTAPADLSKEAHTHPKLGAKKQKNVNFEELEGRVGRIYMPKQDLSTVALAKAKGLKRSRREAAADRKEKKQKAGELPADPQALSLGAASDEDMADD